MKNIILISMLFYSLLHVKGQITITSNDLPMEGTTYLVKNDTSTIVSLGSPSSSWQQWDFSSMVNHYYKVADYNSTSTTAYAADFPTSNVYTYGPSAMYSSLFGGAPVDEGTNGYMFWKSDATGFWGVGWRADEGPFSNINVNYNPEELLIGAPATYGTTFTDTSLWELPMALVPADIDTFYVVHREKSITVDAWGELITPYGTFPDVIRYHEYVTEQDSVRSELNGFTATIFYAADTVNVYTFMADSIGYPIAIVNADKNNIIQSIEYLIDSTYSLGIMDLENSNKIKLYPNPANNHITIQSSASNNNQSTLIIFDVIGNEIKREIITNKQATIDIEEFYNGIYLYQFIQDGKIEATGKFIKE